MKYNECIKECRKLAKEQNIVFKRSKTINKINDRACYELESGSSNKKLHSGSIYTIYETLLSEACVNQ